MLQADEEHRDLRLNDDVTDDIQRKCGLADAGPGRDDDEFRVARSVRQLATRLTIEPLRKTNLIKVSYESSDPVLAARVLNSVANSYMEKHTQIHRPSGEFNFFERQTTQYGKRLEEAELQVMEFARDHGVVSAALERDIALQKLGDAGTSYRQLRLRLTETEQRIRSLQMQMSSLPQRTTTQIRTADNPELLEKLKSSLLDLELKRTELLTKYEPSYRLVEQVDQQIAEAKEGIASEAAAPLRDEITDKDPNYEWAKAELKKGAGRAQRITGTRDRGNCSIRRVAEIGGETWRGLNPTAGFLAYRKSDRRKLPALCAKTRGSQD